MHSFLKRCIILFFTALPVFAQNEVREQGLLTLEPYWRQALGGEVLSLPSVQAQSAVVALDGGNIKAYSSSGTPMWNYSARGRISPYVTRSREGTSYFSRTNGTLIAVNRSGRELWRRDIGSPLSAGVVTGWDGRLFVPADRKIFCFTASGNLLWTAALESPFSIAPKLDRSGGILFALENNEVHRIDHFGSTSVWMLQKKPAVLLSTDQQQVVALYTDGTMEILGLSGEWYISAAIENPFLTLPRLSSTPVAAAIRGNSIAAILDNGRIAFVSLDERKLLWEGDSHIREMIRNGGRPETEAEVLFYEKGIYVLSRNGAAGFSRDGRRLWWTLLQNTAAIPALGDDGVLYSGGKDWILYAYKVEDRITPAGGSLYGPSPEGSYGTGSPQAAYIPNIPLFEHETRARLELIEREAAAGRVGADEGIWTTFLLMLSASQEHVQLRVNAIRLLGQIGSRETIPWLVNIFRRESEPVIKAAAASAIGAIGVDPQGIALQAFFQSITQAAGLRDEQVLSAVASATGALCRFSGPPLSENGIRLLNLLSGNSQPAVVRNNAQRELASLR